MSTNIILSPLCKVAKSHPFGCWCMMELLSLVWNTMVFIFKKTTRSMTQFMYHTFCQRQKGGVTHMVTGNIFLIIWCKLSFRFNCIIPPINLNLIRKHLQLAVMTTLDCFNKKNRIERKNSKNWHNNIINSKIPVLIYFVLLHLLPCLSL